MQEIYNQMGRSIELTLHIDIRNALAESAILSALANLAISGDKRDDISENEAFSKYGKSWINDRRERGYIHFVRIGKSRNSPKMYSRFEIEVLKRTEKIVDDAYESALKKYRTNVE